MDIELDRIHNVDCLEGIRSIKSSSVKAIITDPPYFIGMTHNGQKGTFDDLAICTPFYASLFNEFNRILKHDGSIYWFTDWRGYAYYYPLFDKIIGAKNMLVWDKGSGAGNFYTFEHELIIFGTNDMKFACKNARNIIRGIKSFAGGAKKTDGEKVHPTQKPQELIKRLVLDSTNEGDTVLDCFMGSGTTAVVCVQTNRHFVGFEIQEKYVKLAEKRLEEEKKNLTLQFDSHKIV